MSILEIHPDNSVTVQITLSNPILSAPVNDATVVAEIQNAKDEVIKASFSLDYVAGSEGVYRTTLPPIATLVLKKIYTVVIDATGTDALKGHWEANVRASLASVS